MDVERMHEMIEKLSETAKCEFDKGVENVDTCEMKEVIDMMKDLSESIYYRVLTESMLDADAEEIMDMFDRYGEDRRYYDHYRYKNGRFAPKGRGTYRRGYMEPPYYRIKPEYELSVEDYKRMTPEELRDMDRKSRNVMYYTEPNKNVSVESRYDKARRMYTETKDSHRSGSAEDKTITLREGEKMLNVIFDELNEILQDASPEMRNMVKTKGLNHFQKMN